MKRVCAICGKTYRGARREPTYGFRGALKMLGLPNWQDDKAHRSCVRELEARAPVGEGAPKTKK